MNLAIFDLDNTLLEGDSDYLWGQYLAKNHIVDARWYERENQRYYDEYLAGTLDIYDFLRFQLHPLSQHPVEQLKRWRSDFLEQSILPIIQPGGRRLIAQHRQQGHICLIITATNLFITAPIAQLLGIEHLIATIPEFVNGKYTGNVIDTPCFREGKVIRLQHWLKEHQANLEGSWFYTDSHNDLPLMQQVSHPVAVNPDSKLAQQAEQCGWQILRLSLNDSD